MDCERKEQIWTKKESESLQRELFRGKTTSKTKGAAGELRTIF